MSINLLRHNRDAYKAVMEQFNKGVKRTCVIHPTGTGKSYIAMKYIEDHPEEKILFITSYLTTLSLFAADLKKFSIPTDNLDLTIYKTLGSRKLYDMDALTDRYAKSNVSAKTFGNYDTIIVDEFHRIGADTWEKQVKEVIEGKRVLGFSATPIRYLDDNRDMAKDLFDGNVASKITLHDALVDQLLPMPEYITCRYSLWDDFVKAEGEVKYKWLTQKEKDEASYILSHARQFLENAEGLDALFADKIRHPHGRYIVFCRNKEHLQQMKEESEKWFSWADDVHYYEMWGGKSDSQREISRFQKDDSAALKLLFCIDMLNEGVHIKNINGLIMLRPTTSMIVYLQQLGRALAVDTKDQVQIFDIVNNARELDQGKHFWNGVIADFKEKGVHYDGSFDVFARDVQFDKLLSQLDKYRHADSWDYFYDLCKDYYEKNCKDGVLFMPVDYTTDGVNLYSWIIRQRFHRDELTDEKIAKLDAIGMVWNPNEEIDLYWMKSYNIAREYYEEFGNLDVTAKVKEYHGLWLYDWVKANRRQKLTQKQIDLLDAIGMVWDKETQKQTPWDDHFAELVRYKEEHGDINIPNTTALGEWLKQQRHKHAKGTLSADKCRQLESLGILWNGNDGRKQNSWDKGIEHCKEYYKEHGNINVPKGYVCEDGYNLSIFIKNLRKKNKEGGLSDEQIEILRSMGLTFSSLKTATWDEKIELLKKYKEEHGDLLVPWNYETEDGFHLGTMMVDLSSKARKGEIDKERLAQLEEIGFSIDTGMWKKRFARLEAYKKEHGNLRIPAGDPDYPITLKIRQEYREGKIDEYHLQRLKEMGFDFDDRYVLKTRLKAK